MSDIYWEKRQGYVMNANDENIDGCVIFEFGQFEGRSIYSPLCIQNGFPFKLIQGYHRRYKNETFCYIEGIHLAKEHRGRGIGSELLEKPIKRAKEVGAKVIFVIISPEEELHFSMENWFSRKGFSVVSRLEDGTPLMALELFN